MTEQEIFDQIAVHLLKQGRQAFDTRTDTCVYRQGKLSCAIGCLIRDADYSPAMEGRPVDDLARLFTEAVSHLLNGTDDRIRFLVDAQVIHDDAEKTSTGRFKRRELRDALRSFARENNLNADAASQP